MKECFHRSFLFQLGKTAHHNLINNLMPLEWRTENTYSTSKCCVSLRITKTLQKHPRKVVVFMAKMSLLTAIFKTGSQNIILTILHYKINSGIIKMLQQNLQKYNQCKSTGESSLDLNTSQFRILPTQERKGKKRKLSV